MPPCESKQEHQPVKCVAVVNIYLAGWMLLFVSWCGTIEHYVCFIVLLKSSFPQVLG